MMSVRRSWSLLIPAVVALGGLAALSVPVVMA